MAIKTVELNRYGIYYLLPGEKKGDEPIFVSVPLSVDDGALVELGLEDDEELARVIGEYYTTRRVGPIQDTPDDVPSYMWYKKWIVSGVFDHASTVADTFLSQVTSEYAARGEAKKKEIRDSIVRKAVESNS